MMSDAGLLIDSAPRAATDRRGPLTTRQHWIAIIGTACIARAAFVFLAVPGMGITGDAIAYSRDAVGIVEHFPGLNAFFWPPGISYVLAAGYAMFGYHVVVAQLTVLMISVAAVASTRWLAGLALRDERNARRAGWIAALYPPAVFMSGDPYSHTLGLLAFTLFAAQLVFAYERRNHIAAVGAGLALGVGVLTRPSGLSLGLGLAIVALAVVRRRRTRLPTKTIAGGLALIFATVAVVIAPVGLFNSSKGHGFTIATNTEYNFFIGNNPYTPPYKTSHLAQRNLDAYEPEVRAYLGRFWDSTTTPTPTPEQRSVMRNEAIAYMISHPVPTAVRTFNRTLAFWGFDYYMSSQVEDRYDLTHKQIAPMLAIEAGGSLAVLFLALLGLLFGRDRFVSGWAVVLLVLVGCYQLPYVMAFSAGVYHFDIMGLLMPFAAVGVDVARNWRRRQRTILFLATAFTLVQLEYAHYILKYS